MGSEDYRYDGVPKEIAERQRRLRAEEEKSTEDNRIIGETVSKIEKDLGMSLPDLKELLSRVKKDLDQRRK